MGGFGSGRTGGGACTDDCLSIDSRRWQRTGLFETGNIFNWQWSRNGEKIANIDVTTESERVILSYRFRRYDSDWKDFKYSVCLTTTPCNYGGQRYWFICPALGCGRRVALLYLYDEIFACRHCYQLAYRSQRETNTDRLIRKTEKIREKLGWEPGILNGSGWKPKGMHWKTFDRLTGLHDRFVELNLNYMMFHLRRMKS